MADINDDVRIRWEKCCEKISELPDKQQQIFIWFIENFDDVVKICEESRLSEQDVFLIRQCAAENGDAVLGFLMTLKSVLDSDKNK